MIFFFSFPATPPSINRCFSSNEIVRFLYDSETNSSNASDNVTYHHYYDVADRRCRCVRACVLYQWWYIEIVYMKYTYVLRTVMYFFVEEPLTALPIPQLQNRINRKVWLVTFVCKSRESYVSDFNYILYKFKSFFECQNIIHNFYFKHSIWCNHFFIFIISLIFFRLES